MQKDHEFRANLGYMRPNLPEQKAGGIAQWLGTHAALAGDQSSVPSSYITKHLNTSPRGSDTSSDSVAPALPRVHTAFVRHVCMRMTRNNPSLKRQAQQRQCELRGCRMLRLSFLPGPSGFHLLLVSTVASDLSLQGEGLPWRRLLSAVESSPSPFITPTPMKFLNIYTYSHTNMSPLMHLCICKHTHP